LTDWGQCSGGLVPRLVPPPHRQLSPHQDNNLSTYAATSEVLKEDNSSHLQSVPFVSRMPGIRRGLSSAWSLCSSFGLSWICIHISKPLSDARQGANQFCPKAVVHLYRRGIMVFRHSCGRDVACVISPQGEATSLPELGRYYLSISWNRSTILTEWAVLASGDLCAPRRE